MEPQYVDDGHTLEGPDESTWHQIAEWLEPWEVVALQRRGARVFIDWCGNPLWDTDLTDEAMTYVVSAKESNRLAGLLGRSGRNILAASLWQEDDNETLLVVLSEEAAKSKKVLKEFRRLPQGYLS